jgi:hypothetical protein
MLRSQRARYVAVSFCRSFNSAPAPLLQLQSTVNPVVCEQLESEGYAVVDNIMSSDTVALLRDEVMKLREAGLMHLNCTHLVKDNATTLLQKERIWEAELTIDAKIQAASPPFAQIDSDRTLAALLSLFMPHLTLDSHVSVPRTCFYTSLTPLQIKCLCCALSK